MGVTDPAIDIVIYDDSPATSQNGAAKRRKAAPKPIHFRVEGPLPPELEPAPVAPPSIASGSGPHASQQTDQDQDSPDPAEGSESRFAAETGRFADDILGEETDKNHSSKKVSRSELWTRIANISLRLECKRLPSRLAFEFMR